MSFAHSTEKNPMIRLLSAAVCMTLVGTAVQAQTVRNVYNAQNTADAIAAQNALVEPVSDMGSMGDFSGANTDLGIYGPQWGGDITGTASLTSGNTETADVGIFGRAGVTRGLLTHELSGGYSYATGGDETTKNKAYGAYQLNRSFADGLWGLDGNTYAYGITRGVFDQLGAFRHDYFVGVGLGRIIVNDNRTRWTLEAGPGVRYVKANEGDGEFNIAARAASRFNYALNENVGFRNDTTVLWSPKDTAIINDTFLRFGLSDNLDAKLGLLVEYHTDPAAGLDNTDTTTYAGIGYRF